MTLRDACEAYLRDILTRNFRRSTRKTYESLFRAWQVYADERGLADLSSFDQSEIRAWRESWTCEPSTQTRQLQQLKAFFRHAQQIGWVTQSPMTGMKPPRSRSKPTMPLSRDEIASLVAAAAQAGKLKERALILLMRYSGLSIRDAVTLRRDAIDTQKFLTLRRAKSGELVMVPLHSLAIEALGQIAQPNRAHFFWTANSHPVTATKYWRARLQLVARGAGVEDFKPHRLRDTFAVELLLANVPMEKVSTLLGHSSVSTTERYYAPWNAARRIQLLEIMREVNACDPLPELLNSRMPKTNMGAAATAPTNSPAPLQVIQDSSTAKKSIA